MDQNLTKVLFQFGLTILQLLLDFVMEYNILLLETLPKIQMVRSNLVTLGKV